MLNSLLHQFGVLTTFVILFILIQVYTPGWPDTVIPQFVKRILNEAGDTFIRIYWKPEVNGIIIGMTNQCCSTTLFRWGHLAQVTCGGYYQLQCHLMGWLKHYTLQPELLLLRNKNVTINYCDYFDDVQNRFWFNLWNKYTRDEMLIQIMNHWRVGFTQFSSIWCRTISQ